jgi:ubiquinone/menaquinone biosynthesis C-methylase UbiE
MKKLTTNPFDDMSVAAGYEAWYSTVGRRADRLEKALLKELLARFPAAETILEVGCGTGHFTRWFETQGLRAVGLDLSSAMLSEARQHERPMYVEGDAYRLPFSDRSFDTVALITILEFLQDPMLVLKEAQLVQMVKQTGGKGSVLFWKTTLWRWFPWALSLPWGGFIGMGVRTG